MASSGWKDTYSESEKPMNKEPRKKVNTAVLALLITSCINVGEKEIKEIFVPTIQKMKLLEPK